MRYISYICKSLATFYLTTQTLHGHQQNLKNDINTDFINEVKTKKKSKDPTNNIMKYGYPSHENIIKRKEYVLSYDYRLRQASWVMERLTNYQIQNSIESTDRTQCNFREDDEIPVMFRTNPSDYRMSGFDRGHLAAAANHSFNQDCLCETFFLSNVSPQIGKSFNGDIWEKLERYVRSLTKIYKVVYVCTGPLFLPTMNDNGELYVNYKIIGSNQIAVPTHFFKVILGITNNEEYEVQSYIIANNDQNKEQSIFNYLVSIEEVELQSGLLFFQKIPRNQLKNVIPPKFIHNYKSTSTKNPHPNTNSHPNTIHFNKNK